MTNDEKSKIINAELATLPIQTNQKLNSIIVDIETRLRNIKCDFFEIGRSLSKAKQLLPHGTFQTWIEKHFNKELPYSTAALYMKIFETFEHCPKTVQFLPITFLLKMTQGSFPEEIFKIITENSISDRLDINTISDAYERYKNKEIDLKEFEKTAKKQIDLAVAMEYGQTQKRIGKEMQYNIRTGIGSIFTSVRKFRKTLRRMHYFQDPSEDDEIIKDIDRAIEELQETKHLVMYGDGLYNNGVIDEKTGERGLIPNTHFINSSNN